LSGRRQNGKIGAGAVRYRSFDSAPERSRITAFGLETKNGFGLRRRPDQQQSRQDQFRRNSPEPFSPEPFSPEPCPPVIPVAHASPHRPVKPGGQH
jgi:hypothetical protein